MDLRNIDVPPEQAGSQCTTSVGAPLEAIFKSKTKQRFWPAGGAHRMFKKCFVPADISGNQADWSFSQFTPSMTWRIQPSGVMMPRNNDEKISDKLGLVQLVETIRNATE